METWAVPAFSPSGQHLATQEYFSWISMLSEITPTSLTPRLRLKGRDVHLCTAFSPDGKTLAIGNHRNEIHLYDVADGKSIQILKGHTQWLTSVVFSRDGNHLVSSALDGTVRIWKQWRNEFHLVSTLRGHAKNLDIVQVAVAPGGDSLAAVNVDDNSRFGGISPTSTSQQGIIQVWRTVPREEVDRNVDDQFTSAGDVLSTDRDQTLHELGEVLARAPDDLRARAFRAHTRQRRGDWKSAVDDWTIALKNSPNPNNFYFLESRAKAYMLGQQWTEAMEDWKTLVRLTSESNGNYLLGRGECYLHMGRRQDAHADFLAALAQTADVNTLERAIAFLGFAETVFPTETQWRYLTGTQAPLKWEAIDFSGDEILCGRRALCAKRRGRYRVEAYRGSGTCS
jgi:tetratricopeptide (TPR) repeat protein